MAKASGGQGLLSAPHKLLQLPRIWCSAHSWWVSTAAGVTKWKQLSQCTKIQMTKAEGSYFPVNESTYRWVRLNMRVLRISLSDGENESEADFNQYNFFKIIIKK